jgi:DNA N-6-adenine-methyltransferase (Dam)
VSQQSSEGQERAHAPSALQALMMPASTERRESDRPGINKVIPCSNTLLYITYTTKFMTYYVQLQVDSDLLVDLERDVSASASHVFLCTGEALMKIHDMKLFRAAGCGDFRQYITMNRDKFGFTYKKAEKLMHATRLVMALPSDVVKPLNLMDFLPMVTLPCESVTDCWKEVLEQSGGVANVNRDVTLACVKRRVCGSYTNLPSTINLAGGCNKHNTNNWYTPVHILDIVKRVFGGHIDVDPCSDATAQLQVQARTHYTVLDDGLSDCNRWYGKVFINPPYGLASNNKGVQELFLDRAIKEVRNGSVQECIMLLKASPGSIWFEKVLTCTAYGWLKGRLSFTPSIIEEYGKAPFGCVVAYLGPNQKAFVECFNAIALFAGLNCWSYNDVETEK